MDSRAYCGPTRKNAVVTGISEKSNFRYGSNGNGMVMLIMVNMTDSALNTADRAMERVSMPDLLLFTPQHPVLTN